MSRPGGPDYGLEVVRGPLSEPWRSEVQAGWGRYDPRLRDSDEWRLEFEDGPEGPAVHALALTPDGHVAGHHCAIPLRLGSSEESLVVGKGEALYVDPERRERGARVVVDGRRLRLADALTSGLYARYRDFGLAAYFGFATPEAEVRHVAAGCNVVVLPYRRFLLFHDAAAAFAGSESSLTRGLRGSGLRALAGVHGRIARARLRNRPRDASIAAEVAAFPVELENAFRTAVDSRALALDPSARQLGWRFPSSLYRLFVLGSPPSGYAVLTRSEEGARARVVDWLFDPRRLADIADVVAVLTRASAADGAAAFEWIVPTSSRPGAALADALRRTPLVPDPRGFSFRMVVHGGERFLDPAGWALTLATQERF